MARHIMNHPPTSGLAEEGKDRVQTEGGLS